MTRKFTSAFVSALSLGLAGSASAQAVFGPGTSAEYRQMISASIAEAIGLDRFDLGARWGGMGALGDSIRLDYSFVPDGLLIPSQFGGDLAGNSVLFATLDSQFGGDRDAWQNVIAAAFDGWTEVSGFNAPFRQRVIPMGEDPADNWDDGADWDLDLGDGDGVNGPASDGTVTERGDIRFGMRSIDGPGGILAFTMGPDSSDIILDADEDWADAGTLHLFMENAVGRSIGKAIGVQDACPNNGTKLMEPVLLTASRGPQTDDVRAIQALYGDALEANDIVDDSTFLGVVNTAGTPLVVDPIVNVSLDNDADIDFYSFRVQGPNPSVRVFIEVEPVGGMYDSGPAVLGVCLDPNIDPVNANAVQNLSVSVQDDAGMILNDGGVAIDENGAGESEELIFQISANGNYNIVIEGDGDDDVQLYRLLVTFERDLGDEGEAINDALVNLGVDFIRDEGIRGGTSMILNIEGQQANTDHIVFFGRSPDVVDWNGLNPSLDQQDGHSTGVLGVAGGSTFDTFRGVADEADLATGSIARELLIGDTFLVSRQALAHALFNTTTVEGAAALGLPKPVTVINSSWGTFGDFVGEGQFAKLYDEAATMRDNLVLVHAVGNGGFADAQCDGSTAGSGTDFIGQRTITSPATSYNGIAVGSMGIDTFDIVDDPEDDTDSLTDYFANLGIPLAAGPDLSFGLPILLDPSSSRGPINSFDHMTGATVEATRSGVDIIAPGVGFIQYFSPVFIQNTCDWAGHGIVTGITVPQINTDDLGDNAFFRPVAGSSYAAAIVSGAVALLQDMGNNEDPPMSTSPVLLKSILQNTAVRQFGWTNTGNQIGLPQDVRDGGGGATSFVTDRSPFDYAQGAGLLNFFNAMVQYKYGIRDVVETDPTVPMITRDIPPFEPGFTPDSGQQAPVKVPAGRQNPNASPRNAIEVAKMLRNAEKAAGGDSMVGVNHRRPDVGDGPVRRPPLTGGGDNGGGATPFDPFRPLPGTPPGLGPFPGGNGPGTGPMDVEVMQNRLWVGRLGWDRAMLGQIEVEDPNNPNTDPTQQGWIDYVIGPVFSQETVHLTLNWNRTARLAEEPDFSDPLNQTLPALRELELEDLNIAVYLALDDTGALNADPDGTSLLGFSSSRLNNSEQVNVQLNPSGGGDFQGFLVVRVFYGGTEYDLFDNLPDAEIEYALTWNVDYGAFEIPVDELTDVNDLNMVVSKFGSHWGDAEYDVAADFNRDRKIDAEDLNYVISHWAN
ncbi:MAG: S8 family serine peptidase [Phycisphaerales bacterium]|nr:S8 family serine peptidase [Phycisphaerales bacterium]